MKHPLHTLLPVLAVCAAWFLGALPAAASSAAPAAPAAEVGPLVLPEVHRVAPAPGPVRKGRLIHVNADAKKSGDGSARSPFKTLQEAHDITEPNDTVYLRGTFRYSGSGDMFQITRSGAPGQPVTYTTWPGHRSLLKVDLTGEGLDRRSSWCALKVNGASHIVIDGLTLRGPNKDPGMTLELGEMIYEEAVAGGKNWDFYASTNTNGIIVGRRKDAVTGKWIHAVDVVVRNCDVSLFGGAGIGAGDADYITIENNHVYDNCWYNMYATSGIMVSQGYNSDDKTGYKYVVANNVVHGNESRVKWVATRKYSDGNGIIADLNIVGIDNPGLTVAETYRARTLIVGNLCYNNGGSGLHSVTAIGIDYIHNTAYHNTTRHAFQGSYPELGALWYSRDNRFYNNLVIPRPGGKSLVIKDDSPGCDASHNAFHLTATDPLRPGDVVGDPRLRGSLRDLSRIRPEDFVPTVSSPLIDRGRVLTGLPHAKDARGVARSSGRGPDIGAFEYSSR